MEEKQEEVVLVTGASGYLGERLCHALLQRGSYRVKAFVRPSSHLLPPSDGIELIHGDVGDPLSLIRALNGCSAVFHCAALVAPWAPDPSLFFKVNVDGLKNVISAVKEISTIKKLVYVSSFFALGPSDGKVADESQVHPGNNFCTEYERSKVTADSFALEEAKKGLPIVLTYPGVIYGAGKVTSGNSLVSLVVERCSGRLPGKLGNGEDRFSFVHVDDVATGCIAALEKGKKGERYLLTGENASMNQFFNLVDIKRGRKSSNLRTPLWMLEIVGWVSVSWAKLTGYTPAISYPIESDPVPLYARNPFFEISFRGLAAYLSELYDATLTNLVKLAVSELKSLGNIENIVNPDAFITDPRSFQYLKMVHVLKKQWSYSNEKAKRELGYKSRPLEQGVDEFLTWMESTGLIKKQ